jgi:hypothetical protein
MSGACPLKAARSVQVLPLLSPSLSLLSPALTALEYHPTGGLLLAISGLSSKNLEMFRMRSAAEVKKKIKRRAKRQREKADSTTAEGTVALTADDQPCLEDYFESVANLKSPHKIKSVAFA